MQDPYQMQNLIDDEAHKSTCEHLESLMQEHMQAIGDEMMPRDYYYKRFNVTFDHRGKVIDLVENIYARSG